MLHDTTEQDISQVQAVFQHAFPRAKIEVQVHAGWMIRIRITDSQFQGMDIIDREKLVFPLLNQLEEDLVQQITMLLARVPGERKLTDEEFDDPTPIP